MINDRWHKIREFEIRYKRESLRRMSEKESLDIFFDLYESGQKLLDKNIIQLLTWKKSKHLPEFIRLPRISNNGIF
jgi:hypothetical protein